MFALVHSYGVLTAKAGARAPVCVSALVGETFETAGRAVTTDVTAITSPGPSTHSL